MWAFLLGQLASHMWYDDKSLFMQERKTLTYSHLSAKDCDPVGWGAMQFGR
jgi:hypothetical protein